MLSIALYLLTHAMLLSLHLSGGSFPRPLSAQEEKKYVERMLAGDIEARNVLVEHNLRLVAHIAKKYYTQSDEQDDLISIGTIGLIKGVSSYRPEKGTRLATYAAKCVENEILMYFRSRKKLQGEVSLNDSLDSDADGESLYLMDVVGVEDTMYLDIQDRDDCLRVRRLVHECLTEREEEVIISRYGLGGRMPRTQREVAKKLGISRSYVSRIEKRALQKLEEASLSAQSSTKEEASLRMQEAQLISRFVAKARTVVPKGEVILNESNIDSVLLEDGDVINIPEKTSLVMVHGEVLFPNAVSWQKGMTTEDYIEKCGGLTQKSGNARIIVIRQNGAAVNAEDVDSLKPGDEIMVLPKYESKNIEVTRGISTILYQLAVGAKVILSL